MNRNSLKSLVLTGVCVLPLACGAPNENRSEPKFQVGGVNGDDCKEAKKEGPKAYLACKIGVTGHEVLTRSAIQQANL
ncbi:MAG: hypothetical protein M3Q07_26380, partial [Pseudobdellovibrionaceae bacterium]|nr:hypothetical protein [Pseudobdellovibrionaceae bacterium]